MTGTIAGKLPATVGLSAHHFLERDCWIDCRGELIISPLSYWGFNIRIYTATHEITNGVFGGILFRKVHIKDYAWICSDVVLFDCTIGEHAIVSIGSVVSGFDVEPYTMVAGNPAVPIARLIGDKWTRI